MPEGRQRGGEANVAARTSARAIGELVTQTLGDLGGTVEMGEMSVREEARGLLLPTAIFARWSR
jgi:23S rRNA (cytosine1962-C5)-methyltransferase